MARGALVLLLVLLLGVPGFVSADMDWGPIPDVPAASVPDSIHMVFGPDARTSMTVVWRTPGDVEAAIRYRELGANEWRIQTAAATRWPESVYKAETTGTNTWHGRGYRQVAALTGLEPGATYEYELSSDARWTDTATFRVAPRGFKGPVTFTAWGDASLGTFPRANAEQTATHAPAFHLNLGDVSYASTERANTEEWWMAWFQQQAPLVTRGAFMPAMGNHDRDPFNGSSWYHSQVWPIASTPVTHWSFRWGDIVVVSIWSDNEDAASSERAIDFQLAEAAYVDEQLTIHDDAKWRIVTMHSGLYGTADAHGPSCHVRNALEPVLLKHGVDLVLAGHDHHYERIHQVAANALVAADVNGVYAKGAAPLHLVVGTGGQPDGETYSFTEPPTDRCSGLPVSYSAARAELAGHAVITQRRDALRIEWYEYDGDLFDAVEIRDD